MAITAPNTPIVAGDGGILLANRPGTWSRSIPENAS